MDYEREEAALRHYMERVGYCASLPYGSVEQTAAVNELRLPARAVNRILARLRPDHGRVTGKTLENHQAALRFVDEALRLINAIRRMDQLAALPDPNPVGPALPMELLDEIVLRAAHEHWRNGHYRSAVGEAALRVNDFTQRQLRRYDISDSKLMAQAFSPELPKPGEPRLRCPGDPKRETVRSQQHGAMTLAQGCFEAIRNPAHHSTGDWNPLTAFHYLTVLSLVADWVRRWKVEHAPPAIPG